MQLPYYNLPIVAHKKENVTATLLTELSTSQTITFHHKVTRNYIKVESGSAITKNIQPEIRFKSHNTQIMYHITDKTVPTTKTGKQSANIKQNDSRAIIFQFAAVKFTRV